MRTLPLLGWVAYAPTLAAQTLFTFAPIADATTDSTRPTTNLGSDPELSFGKTSATTAPAAGFRRGHVQFDLSSLIGSGLVPNIVSTTCVGDSFNLGVKEFELTSLAQRWPDGSSPNNSFVIRDVNERSAGASRPGFGHSREFATVSLQPRLESSCNLLVTPQLQAGLPATSAQGADFALLVPGLPILSGMTLFAQFIASTPAFGLETTDGLSIPLYD